MIAINIMDEWEICRNNNNNHRQNWLTNSWRAWKLSLAPQSWLPTSPTSRSNARTYWTMESITYMSTSWTGNIIVICSHFVNNLTIGPPVVASLRKAFAHADLDCHLMVTHPENYIEALAKSQINCFTFHYEATYSGLREILLKIREHKIATGVSIKPGTSIPEKLVEVAKEGLVDKILVMTVEPGFGAQKFMEDMLPKIQ